mgnify:FL=1
MKTKVLFLCVGNSARSQMAESILRHYGGDEFEAYSAGMEARGIHPLARQVVEEAGLSMDGQTSKTLDRYLGKEHFGYVITLCDEAEERCPVFPGMTTRLHWNFEDPAAAQGSEEEKLGKFREVRDQIQSRILAWLAEQGVSVEQANAS